MDLALLITSDTAECVIKNPKTGKDTEIKISIHGPNTKVYRETIQSITGDGSVERDPEKLADITAGWSGVEWDGKPFEFTKANAADMYRSSLPVRAQIIRFALDLNGFLPSR